ncbi:hypothetical protein EHQ12_18975 [Leptospira gomenensis]|uniref:Uncharacterized protein n=1 Tax=Leptospira gomenensis TaxID=2484974 RepID=A0A5F1YHN8_9LEPT|nr:hypothetical protein [Leptospira gomenensis]TGK31490.1 hypothetical protein EHQ17_13830 [Leptospira gomenensis]TGK32480.1 hypothetical protein EHQ12_18975 [Leptospira gomenensis]TGK46195.1 hypothetical protein EHQ07_07065 [Leptospira gomenensis]TGK54720.1 hypothetical protein EHQ13_18655 [Leptospira gomenensis]
MSEFEYDYPKFRKNLILRSSAVVLLYFAFLVWNFLKVPEESRTDFVRIFGLFSIVLGFLLLRNFTRQLQVLRGAKVELTQHSLKLYNSKGQSFEIRFKSIVTVERDRFRSYSRFLINTKEDKIPVLNLADPDAFQEELEKRSGKKTTLTLNAPAFFHPRTLLYFLPTFAIFAAVAMPNWNIKPESAYLIANVNALLVAVYFPEDKIQTRFSAKRRWIFLLGALLIAQALRYLNVL